MKVIMQPASPNNNRIVNTNLERTLKNTVSLERILSHLRRDQHDDVKSSFDKERLKDAWVWGVLPKHHDTWATFSSGDRVVFGGYNEVSFTGTVLCTIESSSLAENIWTNDPNEGPFSCIYFLKDLVEINGDKDEFSSTRKEANLKGTGISWQGLMVIKDTESVAALNDLIGYLTGDTSKSDITQPPKDTTTPGRSRNSLLEEGAEVEARGKRRKRSIALRNAARDYFRNKDPHKKLCCHACKFSAPAELPSGREVIQIHHQEMISSNDSDGQVIDLDNFDYDAKLLPLCPTCHVIAHTSSPPLNLSQIKRVLGKN